MGATDSEMGAPEGLLSVFIISGLLLGTCLSEQACVDDACFDQSIQQLKIEPSKIDQASGLNYRERSTDLVATIDVIGVCLPGVNPNVLADSFQSCSDEKVEEVCTMVKRGWLEDKEGKSVVNENALLAMFKGLKGGEDAVRECLQIPELYEYKYYYYDYLEESASGSRQRRAAGKKEKEGKGKNGKTNRNPKKTDGKKARKSKGKDKRKGKDSRRKKQKNTTKKSKKAARKAAKRAKKETKKNKKKARKASDRSTENKKRKKAEKNKEKEAEKEAKKTEAKESSNGEKDARKKALSKLGLKKMPSKSTLEKLECVQNKITELLIGCAKNILSKTN